MGGKKNIGSGSQGKPLAASLGPSNCSSRNRAEDAAAGALDMARIMNEMSPDLLRSLIDAREAAAGIHRAFPEGDQRFVESESDNEEETQEVQDEVEETGVDAEVCRGLLDDRMDSSPLSALKRAKDEYNFDIVKEMDDAGLEFFDRIRIVNYLRKITDEGTTPDEAVRMFRSVVESKESSVLKDDAYLEPHIEGDVLLTVLESEETRDEEDDFQDVADAVTKSLKCVTMPEEP